MKIYTIYKATNTVNNKIYIGFDSDWPTRKYSHKNHYHREQYKTKRFYKAINKHGWDKFNWEIIYQSKDKTHCLQMETHFIKEYQSYVNDGHGYNLNLGGEGNAGHTHSEETKNKISQSTKLTMNRPEIREKLSKAQSNPNTKLLKSIANKQKWNDPQWISEHSYTCEYCDKTIFRTAFVRYHGDKCKSKPTV